MRVARSNCDGCKYAVCVCRNGSFCKTKCQFSLSPSPPLSFPCRRIELNGIYRWSSCGVLYCEFWQRKGQTVSQKQPLIRRCIHAVSRTASGSSQASGRSFKRFCKRRVLLFIEGLAQKASREKERKIKEKKDAVKFRRKLCAMLQAELGVY